MSRTLLKLHLTNLIIIIAFVYIQALYANGTTASVHLITKVANRRIDFMVDILYAILYTNMGTKVLFVSM